MELIIKILIYVLVLGMFGFEIWLSLLNYKNRLEPIPKEVDDIYDEKAYDRWLKYTMENFRFGMVVNVINTTIFILLLVFGVYPLFAEISEDISGVFDTQILIFMGLYFMVSYIVGLFTSYYRNFSIEQRYGFNKTKRKTFIIDQIKKLILTIGLGGGIIFLLTTLYTHFSGYLFFLLTWISIVSILLIVNLLYVKMIIPLFNKLRPLEDGELKDMIHQFAETVGYEVSKISVIDASKRSSKLNAFFSGFGKFKQIVLYDTLINKSTNEQIVAVLAHEIGHNKHKHIIFNLIQMIMTMTVFIGVLMFCITVPEFSTAFGFSDVHFGFAIILFSVVVSPLSTIINIATSYFSRKHEYQADHYAATKYSKEHMESALKVLSKENYSNLTPHPLYVKLLYSHPPVALRIREIRKVEDNE